MGDNTACIQILADSTHKADLQAAVDIFHSITQKNIVCIASMMKCYMNHKQPHCAISLFEETCIEHDDVSKLLFLKACIDSKQYAKGHKLMEAHLSEHSIQFRNTAIDFYAECGDNTQEAQRIFNSMPNGKQNIVSVGAMMKCFINHEQSHHAMQLFEQTETTHNDTTAILYLKACANTQCNEKGKQWIERYMTNMHAHNIAFVTAVMEFYGHFGDIEKALSMFRSIPSHKMDIVCIGSMMKCYINHSEYERAIHLYEHIATNKNIQHDDVSNCLYLKACIEANQYYKGSKLIDQCRSKLYKHNIEFINAVMDFYGHFDESMDRAINVFESVPEHKKDVVSINTLMTCYIHHQRYSDAIAVYQQFNTGSIRYSDVSHTLYLKACINSNKYELGKQLVDEHSDCEHNHSIEFMNTLIAFHGHFGDLHRAVNIFESITADKRDIVCIGAMMDAYNANEQWNKALELFYSVPQQQRSVHCYSIALDSCAGAVSATKGSQIIRDLHKPENQNIFNDCNIQSAIIRFYAKTRQTAKAIQLFEAIDRNEDRKGFEMVYHAIMDCYAKMGDMQKLLSLFEGIQREKQMRVTDEMYSIVLNGCSHSGLIREAVTIFNQWEKQKRCDINPQIIIAMMDCYGRSNELKQAEDLYNLYVAKIDSNNKCLAVLSLLSACRKYKDLCRASRIFNGFVKQMCVSSQFRNKRINGLIVSVYISMSNIYGEHQQFDKFDELRNDIKQYEMNSK